MSIQEAHGPGVEAEATYVTMMNSTGAAISRGDPVYLDMDANGFAIAALVDDTAVHKIGVAAQDIANGHRGLVIVKGYTAMTVASGNFTAGNGAIVFDGGVIDSTAAFNAAGIGADTVTHLGVVIVGGTAVTEIEVVLHGEKFTATT